MSKEHAEKELTKRWDLLRLDVYCIKLAMAG